MRGAVPPHVAAAVAALAVADEARVLEVGHGPGASLPLLAAHIPRGTVTGLDRSATAVRRAAARCADLLTAGRVELLHGDLRTTDLGERTFDAALAVHVNLFWTDPAGSRAALDRLARHLRPGGELLLAYEPPDGVARLDALAQRVGASVGAAGWTSSSERADGQAPRGVLLLRCRPGRRA